MPCGGPDSISSPEQFASVSPYSPRGSKPSEQYYRAELEDNSNVRSDSVGQQSPSDRTYFGGKRYIEARIAYNKCASSDPSRQPKVPQKYSDFSSPDEAFSYASRVFRGNLPAAIAGNTGSDSGSGSSQRVPRVQRLYTPSSQLLADQDYRPLQQSLDSQARAAYSGGSGGGEMKSDRPRVSAFEGKLATDRPSSIGREGSRSIAGIVGNDGTRYVPYPNSNIYFACPAAGALTPEQIESMMTRLIAYARSHNEFKGKTVYCGTEIADILKAQACGLFDNISVPGLNIPADASRLLSQLRFGSTGQCFAYGRSYNRPEASSQFQPYLGD